VKLVAVVGRTWRRYDLPTSPSDDDYEGHHGASSSSSSGSSSSSSSSSALNHDLRPQAQLTYLGVHRLQTCAESLLVARFKDTLLGSLDDLSLHIKLLEKEARTMSETRIHIDSWLVGLSPHSHSHLQFGDGADSDSREIGPVTSEEVRIRLAHGMSPGGFVSSISGCDRVFLQAVVRIDKFNGASISGAHHPDTAAVLELGTDGHWHRRNTVIFTTSKADDNQASGESVEPTRSLLKNFDKAQGLRRQLLWAETSHADQVHPSVFITLTLTLT